MKRVSGVTIGVVKSLDDKDGQGRILLEFPHLPGAPQSSPAPVAAPLAGKNRGAFFMPEVDDEVLVSFDQGDVNHPYIVGFLWNGIDTPPESDPSNRVILTPGGHTLRFEDGEGNKRVVIKSSSGHTITLDDTTAANSITLETPGQLKVALSDLDSSIRIEGGGRTLAMVGGTLTIS